MNPTLVLLCLLLTGAVVFLWYRNEEVKKRASSEVAAAQEASLEAQRAFEAEREALRLRGEQALADAESQLNARLSELQSQSESFRQHYEAEARRAEEAITIRLSQALDELETLRPFKELLHAEQEVQQRASAAIEEADRLRQEAAALLDSAKAQGLQERTEARQRAKALQEHAEAMLTEATRESRRITEAAEQRAIEIGGDAYRALREKEGLDRAVAALRNTVEGYGDRYIIPTRSLLDDLAADFGHTEAGAALRTARDRSRLMVEHGEAATCDYVDPNRRATAIRFVIDAFNGRVDAILTRVKHDNFGTLEQEIRDAFSLVNLNGDAFRNAQILPSYLDARLAALKWAVVAQELKLKEREEQRRIQEQMREEERARREYEKALREAARDEENLRKAMEVARAEIEKSSAEDKAKYEKQLTELAERLAEAEARNQRALSMAQQTKAGHVYIISNHGSFGDNVLKIGMTRRLEPLERIYELGDASVPFPFDVHAMIFSEDAPSLERMLHKEFDDLRVNKVNLRKEFFRLTLERLRSFAAEKGLAATFTMAAEAREYRESRALEKMSPEERHRYQSRWEDENDPE